MFCQLHAQHATIEAQLKEISAKNEALNKQIEEIKVLRSRLHRAACAAAVKGVQETRDGRPGSFARAACRRRLYTRRNVML